MFSHDMATISGIAGHFHYPVMMNQEACRNALHDNRYEKETSKGNKKVKGNFEW